MIPPRWLSFIPSAVVSVVLTACANLPLFTSEETAVVYALGVREGFPSPLGQTLFPACPALVFTGDSYQISGRHRLRLEQLATKHRGDTSTQQFLVVGYTSPRLPQDYARSLSERRAQAVRQRLIELGVDAARLQSVGLGNDFAPSGPTSDVVVIYLAGTTKAASTVNAAPATNSGE